MNQLIEKTSEYNKPLCLAFVDYEKTIDSVEKQLYPMHYMNKE